jgi:hypothetical protein
LGLVAGLGQSLPARCAMLFPDNPALAGLRTVTDMYFAHGIGALCVSVLIDVPVFGYRIHGRNIFTQRELHRVLCYNPRAPSDNNDKAKPLLIDHLLADAASVKSLAAPELYRARMPGRS